MLPGEDKPACLPAAYYVAAAGSHPVSSSPNLTVNGWDEAAALSGPRAPLNPRVLALTVLAGEPGRPVLYGPWACALVFLAIVHCTLWC